MGGIPRWIGVVYRDGEGTAHLTEMFLDIRNPSEFKDERCPGAGKFEPGVDVVHVSRCDDPEVAKDDGDDYDQPVAVDEHLLGHGEPMPVGTG